MAKKKEEEKIVLERVYNIPLRRSWLKVPRYKRGRKAMRAIREFLEKHMKSEDVKIGKYLNLFVAKHGIRNPPHMVKVTVTKDDKGLVKAELLGAPKEEKKTSEKETKKPVKPKTEEKIEQELSKLEQKTKDIEKGKETKPAKKEVTKKAVAGPKDKKEKVN